MSPWVHYGSMISGSGRQTFYVKDQLVNTLDFVGRNVSVAMTQLRCCSAKAGLGHV